MRSKFQISIRSMLLLIVMSALVAWFVKGWSTPKRVVGQRFALIGPLDIDRDGRDDRIRLKRIIVSQGGTVDYDLPPLGPASGKLGPLTMWYVVGESSRGTNVLPANSRAQMTAAIAQARTAGVRPLPLERLRSRLGIR